MALLRKDRMTPNPSGKLYSGAGGLFGGAIVVTAGVVSRLEVHDGQDDTYPMILELIAPANNTTLAIDQGFGGWPFKGSLFIKLAGEGSVANLYDVG